MKAIETTYKGYRFRSRLEARYAVFFDALGMDWEYEPEGYDLGNAGLYLPDFFVRVRSRHEVAQKHPGAGYWVEIKGTAPGFAETNKLQQLCIQTGHNGYLFYGAPGEKPVSSFNTTDTQTATAEVIEIYTAIIGDIYYLRELLKDPIESLFQSAVVWMCAEQQGDRDVFERALIAARSARFEHGERERMARM